MHTDNWRSDKLSVLQNDSLRAQAAFDLGGVRTLAQMCGVSLSDEATTESVQELFAIWGSEKEFIENSPTIAEALKLDGSTIPSEQALNALLATGTLDAIPMRSVRGAGKPNGPAVIIFTGGVANWMERRVREAERHIDFNFEPAAVFLVAGNRVCQKDTEVTNHFVVKYHEVHGRYPTEAELLPIIVRNITGWEREVEFNDLNQADQIRQLITNKPELAHGNIYVPTNANATFVALQIRRVIREQYGSFDEDGQQFWFSQDGFALATSPEQAADTAHYQRPLTVFSGLVRLLNELAQLT